MATEEALVAEDSSDYVVKNFALFKEQAEWLREQAYKQRRTQADIVREALDHERKRTERAEGRAGG